jgi:hypothetical protein
LTIDNTILGKCILNSRLLYLLDRKASLSGIVRMIFSLAVSNQQRNDTLFLIQELLCYRNIVCSLNDRKNG